MINVKKNQSNIRKSAFLAGESSDLNAVKHKRTELHIDAIKFTLLPNGRLTRHKLFPVKTSDDLDCVLLYRNISACENDIDESQISLKNLKRQIVFRDDPKITFNGDICSKFQIACIGHLGGILPQYMNCSSII